MHGMDGQNAAHVHVSNTSNLPVEALEVEYPLLIDEYGVVSDSGGAGQWRGGLGIARQIRTRDENVLFTARSDGVTTPAPGLDGGMEGGCARLFHIPADGVPEAMDGSVTGMRLKAGTAIRMETPGGGGYGDPAKRDKAALARDLRDGKVSLDVARSDYQFAGLDSASAAA